MYNKDQIPLSRMSAVKVITTPQQRPCLTFWLFPTKPKKEKASNSDLLIVSEG